ncbi:MAG: LLM class flavin-dependent oxidoreductase [Pseudomonadota bacterium]
MLTYGLFLNMGSNLGANTEEVFQLTREQAELAETLGYHDLWVTEHHCIPFGINPSAITASAFLLGATTRIRVGTAVTLSPLHHPLELAERASLLDQFSHGRFDLGIGRGGYLKDYELFDVDTSRWDREPVHSAQTMVDIWRDHDLSAQSPQSGQSQFQPEPYTKPHPPLFLATGSEEGVSFAAEHGFPLQHYFSTEAASRVKIEARYREMNSAPVEHIHTLILALGANEERLRESLTKSLTDSFKSGDWPAVPQAVPRHTDGNGQQLDRADMAKRVAERAIVGPLESVRDQLDQFVETTGAARLVLYMEAIAEPSITRQSIVSFAEAFIQ